MQSQKNISNYFTQTQLSHHAKKLIIIKKSKSKGWHVTCFSKQLLSNIASTFCFGKEHLNQVIHFVSVAFK